MADVTLTATMPPFELSLVVPCYNEAARLNPGAFLGFLASHPRVALLFVDDGSTDATLDVLEDLRHAAPGAVSVLRVTHGGKAEAVRQGLLEALRSGAPLIGFWDADLATPLSAVDDFLELAARHREFEVILGSRVNLLGRQVRRGSARHYASRAFATAVSLALDLPVYDTQCGAKVFRATEALAEVMARPFRSRWIFDVELLGRYLRVPVHDGGPPRRSRIYELAVRSWLDVPGSKLRWTDWLRSLVQLVAIAHEQRRPRQP